MLRSDIISQLDNTETKEANENQKNLLRVIENNFCRWQGVTLRGTDDSSPVGSKAGFPIKSDGNFHALLRIRAQCGDAPLKDTLKCLPAWKCI